MLSLIVSGLAKTMSFNKLQKKLNGDQRNTMAILQIHHIRLWGSPSSKSDLRWLCGDVPSWNQAFNLVWKSIFSTRVDKSLCKNCK